MFKLDHITIIAPSLNEGIEHVRASLGIDISHGAIHSDMGTHNKRLRLGAETYLEVVAIDPSATPPTRPRWFDLDHIDKLQQNWEDGLRLKTWVVRTDNIDEILASEGQLFGTKTWLENAFHFSLLPDGSLPMDGVLPNIIDRGGRAPPSIGFEDQGMQLREFVLEHPSPDQIIKLFDRLEITNPPKVIDGPRIRFTALIDTPDGLKTLS